MTPELNHNVLAITAFPIPARQRRRQLHDSGLLGFDKAAQHEPSSVPTVRVGDLHDNIVQVLGVGIPIAPQPAPVGEVPEPVCILVDRVHIPAVRVAEQITRERPAVQAAVRPAFIAVVGPAVAHGEDDGSNVVQGRRRLRPRRCDDNQKPPSTWPG